MNAISRTISAMDGRKIRIFEAGKPDGIPVIVHSGTPDSGLLYDAWIEDALSRGIRIIGYDRPGYGGSTPRPGRSVASAAEDVTAIAKALGVKRLFVWGSSGGGPHALACAALLPEMVVAAAVLASIAPYPADGLDWFAGMGEDNIEEFNAALKSREAIQQFTEKDTPGMLGGDAMTLVQAFRSLLSPVDAAVFTDDYGSFVLNRLREGIRGRRDGWIDDDIAFTKPWGFELNQIQVPILLMHGGQDQMVPFLHGKWLVERIPNVEARLLADEGHLTIAARRIPDVHAWLLSKQ